MHSGINTTEKMAADTETTATAPSTETSEGILTGNDSPRETARCEFVRILLARCALSSEEKPPVQEQGLPAYMQTVAQRPYLKYTLRLLRNGFVHVYHETEGMFSFAVKKGVVEQGSLCPAMPQESQSLYLRLPKEWGRALLAFSDAPGESFWARYADNAAARTARMHEIVWEGGNGLSSGDTLCGPVSKIEEWVEEFRREPGFVRAPFEYEDAALREYYDPELGHFKPTQEPKAVIRRWRRTGYWIKKNKEQEKEEEGQKKEQEKEEVEDDGNSALPLRFRWLLIAEEEAPQPPAETALAALNGHAPSGLAVLADPAGICMECAALYHASIHALKDFKAWYGQSYALCEYIRALDWGWKVLNRQKTIYDLQKKEYRDITEALLERHSRGIGCIEEPLAALLEFWLEWLNGTGRFSFFAVADDFDTNSQIGSDSWDTTLCLSTYELSAHRLGMDKIRQEMEQGTSLAGLLRERLKRSLWTQKKDDPNDIFIGYPKLVDNCTGLLLHQQDLVRGAREIPLYAQELMEDLAEALIAKGKIPEKEQISPEALSADLLKLFSCLIPKKESQEQKFLSDDVPFKITIPGEHLAETQSTITYDDDITVGYSDQFKAATLVIQLGKNLSRRLMTTSLLTRIANALTGRRQLPDSDTFIAERLCFGLAVGMLLAALNDQCTNKQRNSVGYFDVASNAFGTLELALRSNLSIINKQYGKFINLVGSIFRRDTAFLQKFLPDLLGYAAAGTAGIWYGYLSITDFIKGEWRSGIGNFLIGAGSIMLVISAVSTLGIYVTLGGLVFAVVGKTDRIRYRIARCYFGEKNRGPDSRGMNEGSAGINTNWFGGVLPFSYRRGYVPPESQDNQRVPGFYTKRSELLDIDLATFEFSLLRLSASGVLRSTTKNKKYVQIYIKASIAHQSAYLQVKSLKIIFRQKYYIDIECSSPNFESIPVHCTIMDNCSCWLFSLPLPQEVRWSKENELFMQQIQEPQLVVKMTADFQYMSQSAWDQSSKHRTAAKLLLDENTEFGDSGDGKDEAGNKTPFSLTRPGASEADFRMLKDYNLEAIIDL